MKWITWPSLAIHSGAVESVQLEERAVIIRTLSGKVYTNPYDTAGEAQETYEALLRDLGCVRAPKPEAKVLTLATKEDTDEPA